MKGNWEKKQSEKKSFKQDPRRDQQNTNWTTTWNRRFQGLSVEHFPNAAFTPGWWVNEVLASSCSFFHWKIITSDWFVFSVSGISYGVFGWSSVECEIRWKPIAWLSVAFTGRPPTGSKKLSVVVWPSQLHDALEEGSVVSDREDETEGSRQSQRHANRKERNIEDEIKRIGCSVVVKGWERIWY